MVRNKPWTSKALLKRLFVVKGLSEQEIADRLGTNQSTINRWLRKFELK